MAVKKRVSEPKEDKEVLEGVGPAVVEEGDVIFVNREKLNRAKDIIALVTQARIPQTAGEQERTERYTTLLQHHDVSPKSKDAVRFVYENLLGGLVRTHEEQADADEYAKQQQRKIKKNQMGEKSGN